MNLLDLPAEIFASIIHAHLHDGGWAVAVQARYVCKTFAVAIHNDMFGRYSAIQYRCLNTDWKERLLRPNMHTVLSKMGRTRYDSTYILDHMEATVDFLMDFSFYKTESQHQRYRLRRAIRTRRKDHTGVRELWQGLTAAVENGWLVTTRLLIHSGVRISPRGKQCFSFTPMLWYAVKGGHIDIVVLLLAYGAVMPKRNFAKHDGIWALATKRSSELASLLEEAWNAQVK